MTTLVATTPNNMNSNNMNSNSKSKQSMYVDSILNYKPHEYPNNVYSFHKKKQIKAKEEARKLHTYVRVESDKRYGQLVVNTADTVYKKMIEDIKKDNIINMIKDKEKKAIEDKLKKEEQEKNKKKAKEDKLKKEKENNTISDSTDNNISINITNIANHITFKTELDEKLKSMKDNEERLNKLEDLLEDYENEYKTTGDIVSQTNYGKIINYLKQKRKEYYSKITKATQLNELKKSNVKKQKHNEKLTKEYLNKMIRVYKSNTLCGNFDYNMSQIPEEYRDLIFNKNETAQAINIYNLLQDVKTFYLKNESKYTELFN